MATDEEFQALLNKVQNIIDSMSPIGSIVPFWGKFTQIPASHQLCDGGTITDAESPLKGQNTPDLMDFFLKGVTRGTADATEGGPEGSHQISGKRAEATTLTLDQIANHAHSASSPPHGHPNNVDFIFNPGGGGGTRLIIPGAHLGPGGVPSPGHGGNYLCSASDMVGATAVSISVAPQGGNQPHDHALPAWDNRPMCKSVFYIMRIK